MIVLFTDFGVHDPYVGQVKARVAEHAPDHLVVDLLHDVPDFDTTAGAHLLAALAANLPPGTVFFAVVDPGVGTARDGVVLMADGHWFVGPDNGLLSVAAARAHDSKVWRIVWQPERLSSTFHGRDVFAQIAAEIARGNFPTDKLQPVDHLQIDLGAAELARVIYIDHYGNAWSGLRNVTPDAEVRAAGHVFRHSESFGFVGRGEGFWFINSAGLLELAVNRGSAAASFGLKVGDPVDVSHLA